MRGLQHNVIEIQDTENKNIEKVLVFLKPQAEKVTVNSARSEVQQLLKEIDVTSVREKFPLWTKLLIAGAALVALAIIILLII